MQTEPGYEKTASRPPEGMVVFHPLGEQADSSIGNLLQRLRVFLSILMRNQGDTVGKPGYYWDAQVRVPYKYHCFAGTARRAVRPAQ
jgi:hypothetical protein